MSRSLDRGQAEPLAAIVALLAVGAGLALYAGALADVSTAPDPERAERALERIYDESARGGGVVDPRRLTVPVEVDRRYAAVLVELSAGDRRWYAGDASLEGRNGESHDRHEDVLASRNPNAEGAVRSVTVGLSPGENRPGRLRVVIRS